MNTPSATHARAAAMAPDDRRRAIVEATIPLIVEHGDNVTTRQIAKASCVAEGTIFRVFPDKDAVIVAAIEATLDTAPFDAALEAVPRDGDFETRLVTTIEILQERAVSVWRLLSSIGPRFAEHTTRPLEDSGALIDLLAHDADRFDRDPVAASRLLRALTLSLTLPMFTVEPLTAPQIAHFFLHGVAAGNGAPS